MDKLVGPTRPTQLTLTLRFGLVFQTGKALRAFAQNSKHVQTIMSSIAPVLYIVLDHASRPDSLDFSLS